jgi:hypothetical protein
MSAKRFSLAFVLLAIWPGSIQAHDIYSHVVNELGFNCCDTKDCKPAHYRITATGVQVLLAQTWITVPDNSIIYRALESDTGETYGGHWCGVEGHWEDGSRNPDDPVTRCAILPPNSASASALHVAHQ